jgi:hypothetical protein
MSADAAKRKAIREREFTDVDRRELARMADKELAAWQAGFPSDSPQFILAQYEWQRRLIADQIRATVFSARWQAWFGVFAAIIGALLTLLIEFLAR